MAGSNQGLRLINNNYVPDGSGRDRLIYYDRSFRGGRECTNSFRPHFNNGPTGPGSLAELKPEDRPRLGFNHRAEAYAQVKSLSLSTEKYLDDWRQRSLARMCGEWDQKRVSLAGKHQDEKHALLRVRSDPGLLQPQECPFRRTIGIAHGSTYAKPPPTPKMFAQTAPAQSKFVADDADRHEYPGFSRTPYGGFWRQNSFCGPG